MSTAQEGTGWKLAAVNEIPPVKPDWPATWKSIRHHFGVSSFGINAVTKDAGNVLIPEHDERESGQEEIYFVHVGEVRATLDGETVTIAAGGLVFVGPAVTRKVEATITPTTLIAIGATPGRAYEIGDWEK
jgi:mannose-6-phosphate isomerase-like protein (cupin superfamily)